MKIFKQKAAEIGVKGRDGPPDHPCNGSLYITCAGGNLPLLSYEVIL